MKNIFYNSIITIFYSFIEFPLYLIDQSERQKNIVHTFLDPGNIFYVQIMLFVIHIVSLSTIILNNILNKEYSKMWKNIATLCVVIILAVVIFFTALALALTI